MAENDTTTGERKPQRGNEMKYAPLKVRAIVYDTATGNEQQRRDFDWNDFNDRTWFVQYLCVWALYNHLSVEVVNVADDEHDDRQGQLFKRTV
jgi:hypothetical protein